MDHKQSTGKRQTFKVLRIKKKKKRKRNKHFLKITFKIWQLSINFLTWLKTYSCEHRRSNTLIFFFDLQYPSAFQLNSVKALQSNDFNFSKAKEISSRILMPTSMRAGCGESATLSLRDKISVHTFVFSKHIKCHSNVKSYLHLQPSEDTMRF